MVKRGVAKEKEAVLFCCACIEFRGMKRRLKRSPVKAEREKDKTSGVSRKMKKSKKRGVMGKERFAKIA